MKTHNMSRTPTYESWLKMRKRCRDEKSTQYKWYGARGITYEPRWDKFEAFLEDMGIRPAGKTLDRIDNNKNYTKDNCKWSTMKEQCFNRRSTILITVGTETNSLTFFAKRAGLKNCTVIGRYHAGWPIDKLFIFPK